jgi:predicted amidohydrolase
MVFHQPCIKPRVLNTPVGRDDNRAKFSDARLEQWGIQPMMPDSLTVGIIQFKPEWGDVEKNLSETSRLLSEAKKNACDIAVLPEMWPTGMYGDLNMHDFKEPIPGLYTNFLAQLAKKNSFFIVAGMPERGTGNALHNAAVMIGRDGRILAKHRKSHPYSRLGEQLIWTPGNEFTVIETDIGRVGLLICYEGDFPESWRANALMGADIVFHVSAYESPCENWWDKFYPAASLQNVLWAVLCNTVGDTVFQGKPLHFFGRSRILAPDGEVCAQAPTVRLGENSESFLLVETLDAKRKLDEARDKYGNFLADRRPEMYGVLSKRNVP